ncbi:type II toxin-antitoxin system RelE/ParE family toxin [Leptospira alstonii]|uniref:type II toxin-antitoxin system RelE/ParE family toxin n=1 Tax=Leptospira alstonii TaxID=28452 RepID=UPI0007748B63|nr:type II toxin-antitoxin system RelE/ParE family toxin [Leptospira alstonii]
MIISFANSETERIFKGYASKKIPTEIRKRAMKKLEFVNAAQKVEDLLNPPGNRLHKLSGDRDGKYSISIDMQFRIVFIFKNGNAEQVEIVDYH